MDITISISDKNGIVWNKLYHFLEMYVNEWVSSAHLSLWCGQEEEIAADIVQDSVTSVLAYALQHSLWGREKETVSSYRSLQLISAIIAYKQYQKQRQHDARFVSVRTRTETKRVRLRNRFAQEYIAVNERVDPLEVALTSTFQEWYCECLVGVIVKIPVRARTALLIHLANRTRFGTQLSLLLQNAFLKRNIRLPDYRRSLPRNPQERREHEALLQLACGQIMKKQQQESNELLFATGALASLDSPKINNAENDLELAALIARLEATAPFPHADLAFRENLRDKLLDRLVEYQVAKKTATPSAQVAESLVLPDNAGEANSNAEIALPNGSLPDSNGDDPELAVLAAYLDAKTPLAPIDPGFQEVLQKKLKNIAEKRHPACLTEFLAKTGYDALQIEIGEYICLRDI